jgi:hypothetical protein
MPGNVLSRAIVKQPHGGLETCKSGRICRSPAREHQKKLFTIKDLKPGHECAYSAQGGAEQRTANPPNRILKEIFHEHPDPLS